MKKDNLRQGINLLGRQGGLNLLQDNDEGFKAKSGERRGNAFKSALHGFRLPAAAPSTVAGGRNDGYGAMGCPQATRSVMPRKGGNPGDGGAAMTKTASLKAARDYGGPRQGKPRPDGKTKSFPGRGEKTSWRRWLVEPACAFHKHIVCGFGYFRIDLGHS